MNRQKCSELILAFPNTAFDYKRGISQRAEPVIPSYTGMLMSALFGY